MTDETEFGAYKVKRDEEADIRFTGTVIAEVWTSADRAAGPSWSGEIGRWAELTLFKTKSGKFVCERIDHTQWDGEHDSHTARVCETEAEVIEFFGQERLAKQLYRVAKIENAVEVE